MRVRTALRARLLPRCHAPAFDAQVAGTEVLAYVNRVRDVEASNIDHEAMTLEQIESNPVRCPDQASADAMYKGGWVVAPTIPALFATLITAL